MAPWIVFDDDSAAALAKTHKQVEVGVGDPLEAALASEAPAMVMYEGGDGNVAVMTVRRGRAHEAHASEYVATGFLGLSDAPAEEDNVVKKTWWKRLFLG